MNAKQLFSRASGAALLASTIALGGCASDRIGRDAMREQRVGVLIFSKTQRELNEPAARANVFNSGLANPNPIVANATREIVCRRNDESGDRVRTRERWAEVSGERDANVPCTGLPTQQNTNPAERSSFKPRASVALPIPGIGTVNLGN